MNNYYLTLQSHEVDRRQMSQINKAHIRAQDQMLGQGGKARQLEVSSTKPSLELLW